MAPSRLLVVDGNITIHPRAVISKETPLPLDDGNEAVRASFEGGALLAAWGAIQKSVVPFQIDKSAAFRHLKTLAGAGFAQRRGSLGKWVYYELTDRGRLLLRLGRGVELTPLRV